MYPSCSHHGAVTLPWIHHGTSTEPWIHPDPITLPRIQHNISTVPWVQHPSRTSTLLWIHHGPIIWYLHGTMEPSCIHHGPNTLPWIHHNTSIRYVEIPHHDSKQLDPTVTLLNKLNSSARGPLGLRPGLHNIKSRNHQTKLFCAILYPDA